ncbi:MAG: dihydrolipoamide acetyltransferase family protein [Hyphomicrobiales bacterium]
MGNFVFKLPDVGEGVAEAEIVAWHVKVGDTVKEDDPLIDVMTDKATVEIGAPVAGKIVSRKGEAGDKAAVGNELVVIATGEAETPQPKTLPETVPVPSPPKEPPRARESGERKRAPLAAPAVRARARTLGIDLADLEGSGPDGRITHDDLDRLLLQSRSRVEARPSRAPTKDDVEEIRVIGLRRQIAETMLDAKRRIPHFTYVEEVDVTALEAVREDLNEARADRLTVLPFIIRALVKVIPDHPGINALFDDKEGVIRRSAAVHCGIATQTRRGLLVPVIRHAEARDVQELASEIARLSEETRSGKIGREELVGSTITVTSLGPLGGISATPIIKPPEVAIIGVNRIAERPVVRDGRIVVRKVMNLSSSFDHRVVDGFDAASFIQSLKALLETPARLLVGED